MLFFTALSAFFVNHNAFMFYHVSDDAKTLQNVSNKNMWSLKLALLNKFCNLLNLRNTSYLKITFSSILSTPIWIVSKMQIVLWQRHQWLISRCLNSHQFQYYHLRLHTRKVKIYQQNEKDVMLGMGIKYFLYYAACIAFVLMYI